MKQIIIALSVAVVTCILLVDCKQRSDKAQRGEKELVLYCGAGIRPPVAELIEIFQREHGVKMVADYAGSEILLSRLRLAQLGDLYLPGDRYYVEQARLRGMILSQEPVFYWVPTILVRKGNPKKIATLDDLLKPGVKVGLGDPSACAIGRVSWQVLTKNNISWKDIQKNLAFQSLTVNELGMQIQAGSLDAVMVWDAMARYYSEYGDEVSIEQERNVASAVDIGVLKFTENSALAEKFVTFITSERGQEVFRRHGYRTEPFE